jgi:hypothetical protein
MTFTMKQIPSKLQIEEHSAAELCIDVYGISWGAPATNFDDILYSILNPMLLHPVLHDCLGYPLPMPNTGPLPGSYDGNPVTSSNHFQRTR